MTLAKLMKAPAPQLSRLLVIASCAGGLLVGMGMFTFHTAKGTSYLSNDPKTCINCHVMREQYESWGKSSHHDVATCNDCHVPHAFVGKWLAKAEHGWNHSKAFTTGNYHDPIEVKPKSFHDLLENCQCCHGDITSEISAHHHKPGQEPLNCVRCHSNVGHSARGAF